ncbi:hypothetical protein HNY73_015656 [Argiope bruennichi]|uniref:Uncharacterized protein n=1 Tax=Argiope bruennichi TaxID=94029 RepID=A0A8T0ELM7_ARGBR|nr:hypothetical protein HNY73_015656 [Argiope bruennichi]
MVRTGTKITTHTLSLDCKGRQRPRTDRPQEPRCFLREQRPDLRTSRFQGPQPLQIKELYPLPSVDVSEFGLRYALDPEGLSSVSGWGILTPFPFRGRQRD